MGDVGASASGTHGGGLCFRQYDKTGTTTLNGQELSGGYVFGMNGESNEGQWATNVGSFYATSGSVTGAMDNAMGTNVNLDMSFTGSVSAADSYGRVAFTSDTKHVGNAVMYITNQLLGQGVIMTTTPHNSGKDLFVGQIRKQNAAHIAAAHPITGPFVMYAMGLDTSQGYKATVMHGSGSSSAKTLTIDASAQNDAGTLKLNHDLGSVSYTTNSTTGRTTMGGQSADVFYLYDTNEAVFLFADVGKGGGSTPQNMLGWLETQVVPTANSGKWVYSDLAATYFSGKMYSPEIENSTDTGAMTLDSSGNFQYFAQDTGGPEWADWDEGLSGQSGGSATGVMVPDSTLDPSGKLGIFDVNVTQDGTIKTQVYCFASSVDHATNVYTRGSVLCVDAAGKSPKVSIVRE